MSFETALVSPSVADDLHRFFVNWVSGRVHYPALHMGRQPYGVVVTSAWRNWSFPRDVVGLQGDSAPALFDLMTRHRPHWEALARQAPHAAQSGGDPFQRLLSIIGLLASSSDYVSRKAVSDQFMAERLRFGGTDAGSTQRWFAELQRRRNESLAAIGFPPAPGPTDPLLAFIAFLRQTVEWRGPVSHPPPPAPPPGTKTVAA